ncbi:MAG: phosphate signaling complex protein PhoU [Candidatus Coatesbacteria bacterium]|nr:phosphate signaling complex protein PhoU [Candidatus Coatesbacteria bacterium]
MTLRLQREIERLKCRILEMGAQVEQTIRLAAAAIDEMDAETAQKVVDGDASIDQMEVQLEEDCLKILSLHQPVAQDLRLIVSTLKINNDLERMADLAVNVCERALYLTKKPKLAPPFNLSSMGTDVQLMVKMSLDSLVREDTAQARKVIAQDNLIDGMNRANYAAAIAEMKKDSHRIARLMHYVSVSSQLERIADLATNIAEDVIYLAEGDIIRHKALIAAETSADKGS